MTENFCASQVIWNEGSHQIKMSERRRKQHLQNLQEKERKREQHLLKLLMLERGSKQENRMKIKIKTQNQSGKRLARPLPILQKKKLKSHRKKKERV